MAANKSSVFNILMFCTSTNVPRYEFLRYFNCSNECKSIKTKNLFNETVYPSFLLNIIYIDNFCFHFWNKTNPQYWCISWACGKATAFNNRLKFLRMLENEITMLCRSVYRKHGSKTTSSLRFFFVFIYIYPVLVNTWKFAKISFTR